MSSAFRKCSEEINPIAEDENSKDSEVVRPIQKGVNR